MANRYVLKFSKGGYAKFTSHLDMLRFFKRAFRKCGISLKYSQGFNPHQKLSFAQPLSQGYSSIYELLEFETERFHEPEKILEAMAEEMPEGINIDWVKSFDSDVKSLASVAESAQYKITLPLSIEQAQLDDLSKGYMQQDKILVMKRQKKDKKLVVIDIKDKIRSFEARAYGDDTLLLMTLDCGSVSNCSPELVITSFIEFADIDLPRYKINVEREKINFIKILQF